MDDDGRTELGFLKVHLSPKLREVLNLSGCCFRPHGMCTADPCYIVRQKLDKEAKAKDPNRLTSAQKAANRIEALAKLKGIAKHN